MVKRLVETMFLLFSRMRNECSSLKLSLNESIELLEKELQTQYGIELRIAQKDVKLIICRNENGTFFAALTYQYDNSVWMIDFDKKICKKSFRWMDEHLLMSYFQCKLIDNQTISYGESTKILFHDRKKSKMFYALV